MTHCPLCNNETEIDNENTPDEVVRCKACGNEWTLDSKEFGLIPK